MSNFINHYPWFDQDAHKPANVQRSLDAISLSLRFIREVEHISLLNKVFCDAYGYGAIAAILVAFGFQVREGLFYIRALKYPFLIGVFKYIP